MLGASSGPRSKSGTRYKTKYLTSKIHSDVEVGDFMLQFVVF